MTVEGSNTVVTVVKPNKAANLQAVDESYGLRFVEIEALLIRQLITFIHTAFEHNIKVNDIASLSYVTKKDAPGSA